MKINIKKILNILGIYLRENIIKKIFNILGSYKTDTTSNSELKNLIQKLHPLNTNIELIRIGGENDGGYLIPNDFNGIEALFSPGVGKLSLFENQCTELGMKVYMADKSVDGPLISNDNFLFYKKFVGATITEDFITLDEMVRISQVNDSTDLMLQMDIEGYEYETILNVSNKVLNRFRIIVIEFHYLDLLFSKPVFDIYSSVFKKLLQNHECVHIHPNNCCKPIKIGNIAIPPAMEFSFIRKDRISQKTPATIFPHKLDTECSDNKSSVVLPKCWHS